jgi:3-hydroxyisobutyrate dehydrogenase-like beta-hydroxyacid dehydrogenase
MLPNEKITPRSRLGFIELGYLGSRIARRLVGAGLPVIVYDRDHEKAAELAALGAKVERDPGELASKDFLFDTLAKTAVVAPAHIGKLATAKKRECAPQFSVRLMHKNFGLVLAAAAHAGRSMPATEAAAAISAEGAASESAEDFSVVILWMERLAEPEEVLPPKAP